MYRCHRVCRPYHRGTLRKSPSESKHPQRLMFMSWCRSPFTLFESFLFCSFQVGDLVLIILDERHDNYVLFTVGPILYFLHSESLTALDLKPGQPRTHTHTPGVWNRWRDFVSKNSSARAVMLWFYNLFNKKCNVIIWTFSEYFQ